MDKIFFEHGQTAEEFIDGMQTNRKQFELLLSEVKLTQAQEELLEALPSNLNVMAIAEDWSGDVLYYLPVLIQMAYKAGWNLKIFHRDQYPDLILPYRKEGLYHSIPVFVFFDEEFNEVARWIERPAVATKMIDEESLKLRRKLREGFKREWRQETINEILNLGLE